ncbi:hypothetical protein MM300_17100 [Evansella sp. LMS18]|uniref:hypothetical protein n=1 Tax=Evansella sp. LMS18 TaxID=2924033 RepID=UPI0020D1317F|nr:hypothetical protein [Evansella sp. LMS18]UTR09597.1 hypothetical protein MM300_17100 [Evansella sp. LMS18]
MKQRLLILAGGLIGLAVFSGHYNTFMEVGGEAFLASVVFEPFSWFLAIISFAAGFLCLGRILFYFLLPSNFFLEKWLYLTALLTMLFLYRYTALLILSLAVLYAIMEAAAYNKRLARYKRRENQ